MEGADIEAGDGSGACFKRRHWMPPWANVSVALRATTGCVDASFYGPSIDKVQS